MKKILALVLAMVLMLGTTTTAFAASEPEQHSHYMTATAYSYGSFDYGIPETTNFDKYSGNGCTIYISSPNIDTTDSIIVSITNGNAAGGITLNHTTKEGTTANLYLYSDESCLERISLDSAYPIHTFTYEYLESTSIPQFTFYGMLDEEATAGNYSGIVEFNISVITNA